MTFKKAATIILANKPVGHVLMLKRGPTAKHLPNSMVFPGGVLDQKADMRFDLKKTNADKLDQSNESDMAFRICALREMFEESGLLLGSNKAGKSEIVSVSNDKSLAEWREKVKSNPLVFSELFSDNFLADITSLIPWANWKTPSAYKRIFNTMFFLALTDKVEGDIRHCESEMSDSLWVAPKEAIDLCSVKKQLSLPPPQFYELTRLAHTDLGQTFVQTPITSCTWPQIAESIENKNVRCCILPGDSEYLEQDPHGLRHLPLDDITHPKSNKVHRMVFETVPVPYSGHVLMKTV